MTRYYVWIANHLIHLLFLLSACTTTALQLSDNEYHANANSSLVGRHTSLKARATPQGRFGIRKDPTYQPQQNVHANYDHWSSFVVELRDSNNNLVEPRDISDTRLVGIAAEAYNDMLNDAVQNENVPNNYFSNNLNKRLPAVMTALVVDNRIYLSSSMRNRYRSGSAPYIFQFSRSATVAALNRCWCIQCAWDFPQTVGGDHGYSGACGEVGAVHLFFQRNPTLREEQFPRGARIVTWGRAAGGHQHLFDPCGANHDNSWQTGDRWGCNRFVGYLGMNVIPGNTVRENLPAGWTSRYQSACLN